MDRLLPFLKLLPAGALAGIAGWAIVSVHPTSPVLAVIGAIVALLLLSSPFAMLMGFVAVLFLRPAELLPALEPLMLGKLTMVGSIVYLALVKMVRRDWSFASSGLTPFMLWLGMATFVSGVIGTNPVVSQTMFTEAFVKILVLFMLIVNVVDTRNRAVALQIGLVLLVAFIACLTLYMKFTSDTLIEGSRAGGIGMLGDPNDTALTLVMVVPFLMVATLDTRGGKRFALSLLLILILSGIIATQSRGGILALGAGFFMVLRQRVRNPVVLYGILGVVLLGLVVMAGVSKRQGLDSAGIDESAEGRLIAWNAGVRMFRAHPVFGVGFNCFYENFPAYAESIPVDKKSMTAHNSYVLCIAEVGLFGSLPFLGLLLGSLLIGHRLSIRARDMPPSLERAVLQGFIGNLAAVATSAFFLSQTWMWFLHILFAHAAALGRVHGISFSVIGGLLGLFAPRTPSIAR